MASSGVPLKESRDRRLEKNVVVTNFSVQGRRNNARLYMENNKRKQELIRLGSREVATRLHFYKRPGEEVLDSGVLERQTIWREKVLSWSAEATSRRPTRVEVRHSVTAKPRVSIAMPFLETLPPITAENAAQLYDEWVQEDFPVCNWRDLMRNDLYYPERVEQVIYQAKYSPHGAYPMERLAAMVRGNVPQDSSSSSDEECDGDDDGDGAPSTARSLREGEEANGDRPPTTSSGHHQHETSTAGSMTMGSVDLQESLSIASVPSQLQLPPASSAQSSVRSRFQPPSLSVGATEAKSEGEATPGAGAGGEVVKPAEGVEAAAEA